MDLTDLNGNQKSGVALEDDPRNFGQLQDYLLALAAANVNSSPLSGIFKKNAVARLIFCISEKFNLETEPKFLAVELFDRFMVAHIREIMDAMSAKPDRNWSPTIEKIKNQMVLRSLSCIQVAHKVSSNNGTALLCAEIRDVLIELGYNYTNESIMNSELRVLKYLNYRLRIATPYNMAQIILQTLAPLVPASDLELLGNTTDTILEVAYYLTDEIYEQLYETLKGHRREPADPKDNEAFASLQNNQLLLASAIVITAVNICNRQSRRLYEKVLFHVSSYSKVDRSELDAFAIILSHLCLSDPPHYVNQTKP